MEGEAHLLRNMASSTDSYVTNHAGRDAASKLTLQDYSASLVPQHNSCALGGMHKSRVAAELTNPLGHPCVAKFSLLAPHGNRGILTTDVAGSVLAHRAAQAYLYSNSRKGRPHFGKGRSGRL